MKWLWNKTKSLFKWLWTQLKDWHNLVIFAIVFLIVSCEVWVPYIIYFVSGNEWWLAVGSACWAFWLLPLTPFLPLCIAITLAVRRILDKIKERHREKQR